MIFGDLWRQSTIGLGFVTWLLHNLFSSMKMETLSPILSIHYPHTFFHVVGPLFCTFLLILSLSPVHISYLLKTWFVISSYLLKTWFVISAYLELLKTRAHFLFVISAHEMCMTVWILTFSLLKCLY